MSGDNIGNLVFQHKYNRSWSVYNDQENKALNKAVQKDQKTVALPSNKKIIVHLDRMFQKNMNSAVEQEIRCLVYSDNFYSWQWKNDEDEFVSYKPRIVFLLEVACQRKEKILKFYDCNDYSIDLKTFCQVNEKTKFVRPVLREQVSFNMSLFAFNVAVSNPEFKQMVQSQAISFERMLINLPSVSSTSLSIRGSTENIVLPSIDESNEESGDQICVSYSPVDVECSKRRSFTVYCDGENAFSAILNYASCASNTNKFYIIQLLQHRKKNKYAVWQRFGRVGTTGQNDFFDAGRNLPNAKADFESKFYDKTGNAWINKKEFRYVPGKYNLLNVDLNPEVKEIDIAIDLEPPIQSLLEMICDQATMDEIMKEMSYDSNFPLGKLTLRQLKDGYIALNKIANAVSDGTSGSSIVNASSEFYTKIPHNFGRKSPPVIQTKEDIEIKLRMLEALSNLRISMEVLNAKSSVIEHPLNKYYSSFSVLLEPLDLQSEVYAALEVCLRGTHGPTHNTYEMEIIDAFRCHQKNESSFLNLDKKFLLWHGSRITNWVGILKEGLRIAPPEAPTTGCMFGKGLYFADISSKSANYCMATKKENEGLLLFCEVSMGNQMHLIDSDQSLPRSLPPSFDSVVGRGRIAPVLKPSVLSIEAEAPFGPLQIDEASDTNLQYNEYVVYDVKQVKMKYLLRIRFAFK